MHKVEDWVDNLFYVLLGCVDITEQQSNREKQRESFLAVFYFFFFLIIHIWFMSRADDLVGKRDCRSNCLSSCLKLFALDILAVRSI